MESKERSVNVARDLVRIHKSITRGLNISIEKGWQYLHNGFPSPDVQRGYFDYAQTLAVVIHAHHLGEDEVSYPVFKQKIPAHHTKP